MRPNRIRVGPESNDCCPYKKKRGCTDRKRRSACEMEVKFGVGHSIPGPPGAVKDKERFFPVAFRANMALLC